MKFSEAYETVLLSGGLIKMPYWPNDSHLTLSQQVSIEGEGSINVINIVNGLGESRWRMSDSELLSDQWVVA